VGRLLCDAANLGDLACSDDRIGVIDQRADVFKLRWRQINHTHIGYIRPGLKDYVILEFC